MAVRDPLFASADPDQLTSDMEAPGIGEKAELEEKLGHYFSDPDLLRRALTHASANAARSNERLEFLGDRVLGLIVAENLHALYPGDAEGALALKFNALARGAACARAAEDAGLGAHVILASSESQSGGRHKPAILSGTCEAVIAALYLDGGLSAARRFVERYWRFDQLAAEMRDPKTRLQEWAQAPGRGLVPAYRLVGREGPDHAPRFLVEVAVGGHDPEAGEGGSKREAEQDAAARLLAKVQPSMMETP